MHQFFPCSTESASIPTDPEIQGILREHSSAVLRRGDAIQRINVRRSHLLDDSLAAFSRPTFDPSVKLKVRFIGEPAVDEGGPMREYFRLFTQSLSMSGSLFRVSASGILPTHNIPALGKNTYKLCGQTLAAGIIHGAQSPMCFTPEAANFLVHGTTLKRREDEMLGAIPDGDIQGKLQKVCLGICMCLLSLLIVFMHACMHAGDGVSISTLSNIAFTVSWYTGNGCLQ